MESLIPTTETDKLTSLSLLISFSKSSKLKQLTLINQIYALTTILPSLNHTHRNQLLELNPKEQDSISQFTSLVSSYLPAAARLSVVGEVVTDPLVDLTEGHPFARRAVDCKGNEAGVAVGRFTVSVLCSFLLVQCCSWVQMGDFLARPVPVMVAVVVVSMVVAVVVSRISLLDGCPHAELGEPVH